MNRFKKYIEELKNKGFYYFCLARFNYITRYLLAYKKLLKVNQTFSHNGQVFHYFYHPYNATWDNERAVEIPLALSFLVKCANKNILEVGNVLSHYVPTSHDIIDKFEVAPGVLNEDVAFFRTKKKYDCIISISTLEHVGWDETPKNPTKMLDAVHNLYSILKPKGVLFFTVPLGYNPHMDKAIADKKLRDISFSFLKRVSKDNHWKQCKWKEAKDLPYGFPYLNATAIAIGVFTKN